MDAISPARHPQNPSQHATACTGVLKVMAQFVLKIEKLSHIMGPAPVPEMARAYGLRPRLRLLPIFNKIGFSTCFKLKDSLRVSVYE